MKSEKKKLPKFKSLKEEQEFWATHDSTDFIDWNSAKKIIFPNLKPTTKSISIRLPESLLHQIKLLANKQDIPYQSFLKMLLEDAVSKRLKSE